MAKRPSQKLRKTLADLTKALQRLEAPVAVPEDLVIYKALAWRDRDRYDVEQLLTLHGENMDLARVRAFVLEFSQILEKPERIQEFEQLLRQVLGPTR